jgi:Mg-chelatase subunit ChlD
VAGHRTALALGLLCALLRASPASLTAGSPQDVTVASRVRWFDIAAAALGGHVERVSSEGTATYSRKTGWAAENLIDGGNSDVSCAPLCGWASSGAAPQEIVLSFYEHREALIGRVVIDTLTPSTRTVSDRLPRQVEISVSTTNAAAGFTPVATVEMPKESGLRAIDCAPARAKYLRIRILSTYSRDAILIGEIGAFEADGPTPSILQDFPRNLALFALGGAIVSYTSEYASFRASHLIDGDPVQDWRSGVPFHLPQEIVFAFHDDAAALIDRIELASGGMMTAPKVISVSTSLVSPVDGFEQVGEFTLKRAAGAQSVSIRRRARFLKLRILENWGSRDYTSLGEVRILEGSESAYESILFRRDTATGAPVAATRSKIAESIGTAATERENNDEPARANRVDLGTSIQGRIDPLGENDYFKLTVPGTERSVLRIDLTGQPNIRTSLDLLNASRATVKRFDPARIPAEQAAFSWLVDPGEYLLRVTQPPASVVVIWDTSGSMERSVKDLQRAVEGYLDQVSPPDRVNLIRFSYNIEVLLPGFSSDREKLKKAASGKFFADGYTPFYDVVEKAATLLEGVQGNRAIIVMTDGEDAGSRLRRDQFWRLLQEKGIRFYTIGLGEIDRYNPLLGSSARRLLSYTAMATNGRAYFSRSSADLAKFYAEISAELRKPCAYRLRVTRGAARGNLAVRATGERISAVAAPSEIELILDASGSMKRPIGGRPMIDTAKAVLSDIVRQLPDDMHVALRVYGHRVHEGRPGACEDSELVFPFAKLNRQALLSRIASVQALGTTPIAYSLRQIARDVGGSPGEKMIVLVTDGKEECGGDPAAAVSALAAQGIKLKLNIVGFALPDAALKAELRRLAEQTKGQFVDAKDAQSLRAGIEQSLAVPFDVLDAAGAKVADGVTGHTLTNIPEGIYTVRVRAEKPIDVREVRVQADKTTTIELKKEGEEIAVRVAGAAATKGTW